ncbi:MAG: hypothetical protein FWD94_07150 [Treponema sp.]|nr:hypothetical protein [Treponema sp.]
MNETSNGHDKIYNDKFNIWRKKWYRYLQLWHFVFFILCIVNIFIYGNNIINNRDLLILLPFLNWGFSFLFVAISSVICNKPDLDYLEKQYPEFAKRYWPYGRSNGFRKSWVFNELYSEEYEGDPVINEILKHNKKILPLHIVPFVVGIINTIILEFVRQWI